MPKISVLTVTHREDQYLSKVIESLKGQTFQDFEHIIVDDRFEERHLPEAPFPIKHLPPQEPKPYCIFSHAANTGLSQAEGELICFMNDAMVAHPLWLERHWEIYKAHGPKVMLSGPVAPLGANTASDGRWEPGFQAAGESLYEVPTQMAYWASYNWWWAGRNDSAPLQAILEVGGFEELLDGHVGWHDADLGQRLFLSGCRYLIDRMALCWEVPHPETHKPGDRPVPVHDAIGKALRTLHELTGECRPMRSILRP